MAVPVRQRVRFIQTTSLPDSRALPAGVRVIGHMQRVAKQLSAERERHAAFVLAGQEKDIPIVEAALRKRDRKNAKRAKLRKESP